MQLSKQAGRMVRVILAVNLMAGLISVMHYRSQEAMPFILGLALGGAASLLRVFLLDRTVNQILSGQKDKSSAQWGHFIRLGIAFITMLAGALIGGISLLGVVVGIFSYQLATYTLLTNKKKEG